MNDWERVIIVFGVGRSGTTLFQYLLCRHREVAYLNKYHDKFPAFTILAGLSNLTELPVVGKRIYRMKRMPIPSEGNSIYDRLSPDFGNLNVTREDATEESIQRWHSLFRKVCRIQRKPRICLKYTGWHRLDFMKSIFPRGIFIHVQRELEPTAYSFSKRDWYAQLARRLGYNLSDKRQRLEFYGRLIAFLYQDILEAIERFEINPLEISYEDLYKDRSRILKTAQKFCGLGEDKKWVDFIESHQVAGDRNQTWRRQLQQSEIDLLEESVRNPLELSREMCRHYWE